MKKKKMLFITRKFPPSVGGMENGLFNMAQNMPDENLDVKIVALGKSQKHLIWFIPYIFFYTLFNASKYDYLFLGDGLICICGRIAKKVNPQIRRIIILHGLDVSFANRPYQFYLRRNLKKASDVYACNSSYTEIVVREWGLSAGVCTVHHGIDTTKYANINVLPSDQFRKKYNIPESNLIIITVGRLVKRKGVDWFIKNVMTELDGVTYLVIGEGEESQKINKTISETQQSGNVIMLGRISERELADCYFNADIFVMPNYHEENNAEGFGLVALEASLAGLVVLASRVDGIPDAIKDNKNGFLLESRNKSEYINKILDIKNNKDDYKILAGKFKKYTLENYSWQKTCENLKLQLFK